MQLTSIEIWQRIERMGIASAEQCRGWAAEAAQRIKNGDSSDGAQLIRALVELGLLSQFQSQVLVGETEVRLRYAKWLVQRPLEDPIWKFWSEFRAGEGHAVQQSEFHWGRWISASQLDQLRSSGPALARVRALSAVRHPHLQSVLEPEWCDHELGLFVSPLAGKALTRRPSASSFSVRQSVEVIVQIAGALAELHARHVVHGRVLPDRVYYDGTQAVLACDPLCLLTASADPSAQGLLASDLGRFCYAQFIAPEYLAPGQQASAASDVYSLGCLWWWMLCGVPSNPGTTLASAMAAHAHPVPSLPSNVDISEDLKACLSYMLAKNADARFSDAIELQTALRAALKPPVDVQPDVDQARPTALEKVPASTVVKAVPVEEVLAPATATPVPAKVIVAKPVSSARSADNDLVKVVDRGSKVVEAARLEPGAGKIATRLTSGRRSPAKSPAARRRPSNTWLLATIASCTLLIVVLLALNFSGVLQPPSEESIREDPVAAYQPRAAAPAPTTPAVATPAVDLRAELFRIADSGEQHLWLPPTIPAPIPRDLLPPGGQLFLSLRPTEFQNSRSEQEFSRWLGADDNLWLQTASSVSGMAAQQIRQMTIGVYAPGNLESVPRYAWRMELLAPVTLEALVNLWNNPVHQQVESGDLFVSGNWSYYIPEQNDDPEIEVVSPKMVRYFSVGPTELMSEVGPLQGHAGPLTPQLEKLWRSSNANMDFSLLVSPQFLLSDGRWLLTQCPKRLASVLDDWFSGGMRAGLLQSQFSPQWYWELQVIGQSDREAGKAAMSLESQLRSMPQQIEAWFATEPPHASWRAIALRYPRMLELFGNYARFGVEDGVAIGNGYLPPEAASNLLFASWLALQPGATEMESSGRIPQANQPLTIDQFLARPIVVSFDQQPIEVALQMVAEEANSSLPTGTPKIDFRLDGSAFELAGITRNQQLKSFNMRNKSVRDALTEIARLGNPVPNVAELSSTEQKLIWVTTQDEDSKATIILLTTRQAAQAAEMTIPAEFSDSL